MTSFKDLPKMSPPSDDWDEAATKPRKKRSGSSPGSIIAVLLFLVTMYFGCESVTYDAAKDPSHFGDVMDWMMEEMRKIPQQRPSGEMTGVAIRRIHNRVTGELTEETLQISGWFGPNSFHYNYVGQRTGSPRADGTIEYLMWNAEDEWSRSAGHLIQETDESGAPTGEAVRHTYVDLSNGIRDPTLPGHPYAFVDRLWEMPIAKPRAENTFSWDVVVLDDGRSDPYAPYTLQRTVPPKNSTYPSTRDVTTITGINVLEDPSKPTVTELISITSSRGGFSDLQATLTFKDSKGDPIRRERIRYQVDWVEIPDAGRWWPSRIRKLYATPEQSSELTVTWNPPTAAGPPAGRTPQQSSPATGRELIWKVRVEEPGDQIEAVLPAKNLRTIYETRTVDGKVVVMPREQPDSGESELVGPVWLGVEGDLGVLQYSTIGADERAALEKDFPDLRGWLRREVGDPSTDSTSSTEAVDAPEGDAE